MYWLYEMAHAALNPARALADATQLFFKNPLNPLAHTDVRQIDRRRGGTVRAHHAPLRQAGMGDRLDRPSTASSVPVEIRHRVGKAVLPAAAFRSQFKHVPRRPQPQLLIVAPMSGHYATLLRGTVEAFLPNHDVYITDWTNARMVPLAEGRFDLDDYIDYIIAMLHMLGGDTHVIAVCQPSVPVIAAVALMEADNDPYVPLSMTLMGGPIDTRRNPTAVNKLAERARHRLVPQPCHHQGAVSASRLHARRLSGLPATQRLHQHEPRPPHRRAHAICSSTWSRATAIRRTSTANSTTNISR